MITYPEFKVKVEDIESGSIPPRIEVSITTNLKVKSSNKEGYYLIPVGEEVGAYETTSNDLNTITKCVNNLFEKIFTVITMKVKNIGDNKILIFEDGSWMTAKDFRESLKPHTQRLDTGVDETDDI